MNYFSDGAPAVEDDFDYQTVWMSQEEYAAYQFYISLSDYARRIPMVVFMNEENWTNPVVELAYKLFMDELEEGELQVNG